MKAIISPCPNDVFIFDAWMNNRIHTKDSLEVSFADIDITNQLAMNSTTYDMLKISIATLPKMADEYCLLPCGGAIGRGCGPLLLTKHEYDLAGKRVAVPSEQSTAYLLFRLWASENIRGDAEIIVMPFSEIMPAIFNGRVDAGLVIHEARFVYHHYQLSKFVDLGEWWEKMIGLPIPLGAMIARRSLDLDSICQSIRKSLLFAWNHPEVTERTVLKHAQHLSKEVAKGHIDLYVNEFSMNIGQKGYTAIDTLLTLATQEGLVPPIDLEKITLIEKK